jgi:hypothetical protein
MDARGKGRLIVAERELSQLAADGMTEDGRNDFEAGLTGEAAADWDNPRSGGTILFGKRFAARRRKRQPGRARSPAKSQPCGQWQFGVACLIWVANSFAIIVTLELFSFQSTE